MDYFDCVTNLGSKKELKEKKGGGMRNVIDHVVEKKKEIEK